MDSWTDDRLEYPASLSNRSRSYRHGWLCARDDRVGRPRASFEVISRESDEAMDADDREFGRAP
jgi:hypothetical protein